MNHSTGKVGLGCGDVCDIDTGVQGDEGVPIDPVQNRGNGGEEEEEGIEAGFIHKPTLVEAHPST